MRFALTSRFQKIPLYLALSLLLISCSSPELRFDDEAKHLGFKRTVVQGTDFIHVVYLNTHQNQDDELHVYLDGDGSPWINHSLVSANPTPKNALVLRLMGEDSVSSAYLGRPCYHGFSAVPPCTSNLWTNERYSAAVVDTMAAALKQITQLFPAKQIVLIGFSGGGALAMLLAERIPGLRGIVTIAGNLDIDAWSRVHHYSPLTGSKNPALQAPLNPKYFQLHLVGGKDQNIPVSIVQPTVRQQHSAKLMIMPEYNHSCCWEDAWPSVLKIIRELMHHPAYHIPLLSNHSLKNPSIRTNLYNNVITDTEIVP